MHVTYSISLWNYRHYANQRSLERIITDIRHEGYGIELWGNCWNEPDLYDEVGRARLKPLLQGMPVSLHTVGATTLPQQQKQIDAASELHADVLVLHAFEIQALFNESSNWETVQRMVDYASERGVKIAFENGRDGRYEDLARVFAHVPKMHACLDVGHIYLYPPGGMQDYLEVMKERLVHLHLQDICPPSLQGIPSANPDHYTPGPGGIPVAEWRLLWRTLEEIDFQGIAVFEIHPPNPLQVACQARAYLRDILA